MLCWLQRLGFLAARGSSAVSIGGISGRRLPTKCVPLVVVASCLLVLHASGSGATQTPETISESEIADAVRVGRNQLVSPYVLKQAVDGILSVGVVYTPFVRIARHAWTADNESAVGDQRDLPVATKTPVAYVGLMVPADVEGYDAPALVAVIRGPDDPPAGRSLHFPFGAGRAVRPDRYLTRSDAESILGQIPIPGVELFGVFPLSVVQRARVEFSSYRWNEVSQSYRVVSGTIAGPLR